MRTRSHQVASTKRTAAVHPTVPAPTTVPTRGPAPAGGSNTGRYVAGACAVGLVGGAIVVLTTESMAVFAAGALMGILGFLGLIAAMVYVGISSAKAT